MSSNSPKFTPDDLLRAPDNNTMADPMMKIIVVHPRGGRPTIFTTNDDLTAVTCLPGFRCRVEEFFPGSMEWAV